jgi:uncharacterized membrane protein affecting hemolysin expression
MKNFFVKFKFNKREVITIIILALCLVSAYLIYVFEEAKEIPFIYNQF